MPAAPRTPEQAAAYRARIIKGLGWLFIAAGLLLCVAMAFITQHMISIVNTPTRWTGDHAFTVRMFQEFGGVFLFGLLSIANGAWCVRRGALQPVLRFLLLAVGAGLFIAASLAGGQGH